ncbi:GntR family transcriptional regulator|uniref:GntR family transcriptional regulator n=1 Tax=Leuconostoc lactis TaxID=1246 RepID=A0A6L7A735_LEULA|nr:GntR family transcriptional regulator [Leuconostoc lactis]
MTSKYEILKHHILEQILNGELVKGQKLPTESEMMAAFSSLAIPTSRVRRLSVIVTILPR